MASKLLTLSGAALAVLLVSTFPISAVARHGGGGGGGGGHGGGGHIGGFGGGHGGGGHIGGFGGGGPRMSGFAGGPRMGGPGIGRAHVGAPLGFAPRGARFANRPVFHDRRIRHRRAFIVAPAFGYYDYGYGYGYGCYWLRRNAIATGSPYWWSRYNACLYGY